MALGSDGLKRGREPDDKGPPTKKRKREVRPPARFRDSFPQRLQPASEEPNRLPAYQMTEDVGPSPGDFDWLPNIPGRPQPFRLTWNKIYGHRKPVPPARRGKNGVPAHAAYEIQCEERCRNTIYIDSNLKEIGAQSTAHGRLQKPPVCHITPWAALHLNLLQRQSLDVRQRTFTDAFIRSVCWCSKNLRPGHNNCNATGVKTTLQNVPLHEQKDADRVIQHVITRYTKRNQSIWNPGNQPNILTLQRRSPVFAGSPSSAQSPSPSQSSPSPAPSTSWFNPLSWPLNPWTSPAGSPSPAPSAGSPSESQSSSGSAPAGGSWSSFGFSWLSWPTFPSFNNNDE